MARPKSFNEDEAIALVNEFHLKYPEREITSTEFALYAQNHGHPEIKHYSIRRNPRVWEYISKINSNTEKEFLLPVVTWERLDVDSFLAVNNTRSKLKTAIMQRDTYYGEVCQSAGRILEEKKAMEKQINRLNSEITNLQNQVEKLRTVNTNKINQYSAEVVLKCKKVLETYVYPDLCNEILQKEGLDGMFGQNINPSSLESDVLYPDTELDVQKLENCTSDENLACINDLLGGFDDE